MLLQGKECWKVESEEEKEDNFFNLKVFWKMCLRWET